MKKITKWSEYQEYVQFGEVTIEEENGELMLYSYYDTRHDMNMFAVVLRDTIMLIDEGFPYGYWRGAKAVYNNLIGEV